MSARLAQALADTAELAPPVPSPDELWRRGRRRRRRRRTAAALACLVLAAALVWSPVRSRTALEFAGTGADVLPATVADPHLWQRTFDGDPNGPVMLTFTTGHSLNMETALVLVGRDGSYRLDYLSPTEEAGVLSPDGRWLLRENLLDLSTGDTRTLDTPLTGFVPAVWAPDSRTAVGLVFPDGGGTSYGPDGKEIPGPPDQMVLIDVASGSTRKMMEYQEARSWRAAFSPDGRKLAVLNTLPDADSQLTIMDIHGGAPPRTVTLTDRQWLGGPAAWTPDGTQLLIAANDSCAWVACETPAWHIQRVDVATGAITDDAVRGLRGFPTVVAWRDGAPVVQQTRDGRGGCETVTVTATGVHALPLAVDNGRCADYARDLLEQGALGGPGITPSPWQAQWWVSLPIAVLLGALVMAVRLIRRRARRSP